VVRPDVLVICPIADGERLTRAPELIFEVVSVKTARRDEETKPMLYRDEGVLCYVLAYPDARKARVDRLVEGEYRKVGDFQNERLLFELPACTIPFDFGRVWRQR
jgi:Uma2 family endonuclease